jgi:hypothetical protein
MYTDTYLDLIKDDEKVTLQLGYAGFVLAPWCVGRWTAICETYEGQQAGEVSVDMMIEWQGIYQLALSEELPDWGDHPPDLLEPFELYEVLMTYPDHTVHLRTS